MSTHFLSGLIEGFYGHPWSWNDRREWCRFLRELQQQFYFYAPKADAHLRERWLEQWPQETLRELEKLRTNCGDENLLFGVGLSPYEIHLNWNGETRRHLERRLDELTPLEPGILGLLFDDMKGAESSMARIQTDVAHLIADRLPETRIIVCPTYYTPDPILKALFGLEPERYLEQLGEWLDPSIDIFWTGPQVCSRNYPDAHLEETAGRLRRKPFIWDNYPVNDGARMAPFLHLLPPQGRPKRPDERTAGFGINPMNQPWLSRIPYAALVAQWGAEEELTPEATLKRGLSALGDSALEALLLRDANNFQERGIGVIGTVPTVLEDWERGILDSPVFPKLSAEEQKQLREESASFARTLPHSLTAAERKELIGEYEEIDHPAAKEVIDWLSGRYAFQPIGG